MRPAKEQLTHQVAVWEWPSLGKTDVGALGNHQYQLQGCQLRGGQRMVVCGEGYVIALPCWIQKEELQGREKEDREEWREGGRVHN